MAAPADRPRSFGEYLGLVKAAGNAWIDDYAPSMGAALAYYTVFSLGPLLLIVVSIAGLVFGQDAARGEIFGQLRGLMGVEAAAAVQGMLVSVSKPAEGITGTLIGLGLLVVGATTVFGELQDSLDRIWRAPARNKTGGLWGLLRARLLSFGLILGIAFLLMVSLVLGAVIAALGKWWGGLFGGWEAVAQVVNLLVGFALTTTVFAMIYKLMPRVHVAWHDVWLGAIVTSLLFTLGKFLIGLYIGKSGVASGFGAAGSLIVVFIWVYWSAQIFLMGAEFTWVYAQTFGSRKGALGGETATRAALATGEVAVPAPEVPQRDVDVPTHAASSRPTPMPAPTTSALDEHMAPADASPLTRADKQRLTELGAGLALALTARFVLGRLLRRR